MIKRQLLGYFVSWISSTLGIYLCYRFILGNPETEIISCVIAGLVFSLVNSFVLPLVKLLALPLSIITLGLSTVIINLAMVGLTFWLIKAPEMSFLTFIFCSFTMILLNGLVNFFILPYTKK